MRHINAPALLIILVNVAQEIGQLHRVAQFRRVFEGDWVAESDDVRHHQTNATRRAIHIVFQVGVIGIARLVRVLNHRVEKRFGILERHVAPVEDVRGEVENVVARIAGLVGDFPAFQKGEQFVAHGGDFCGRFLGRVIHNFVGQTHERIQRAGRLLQFARKQARRGSSSFCRDA